MTETRLERPTTTDPRVGVRRLGLAAAVGSIGSTILYVVLGALRPGYDPVRQQISVLGTGSQGLWMNLGFFFAGVLVIVGMIGFGLNLPPGLRPRRRLAITILLAFPALGFIICGLFHMDTNLLVHTIGAQIGCGLPIFTFAICGGLLWHTTRPLAVWLIVCSAVSALALLGYMFLSATAPHDFQTIDGGGTVGLWERVLVTVVYVVCYSSLGIISAVGRRHPTVARMD
jgi:hypothetical protein